MTTIVAVNEITQEFLKKHEELSQADKIARVYNELGYINKPKMPWHEDGYHIFGLSGKHSGGYVGMEEVYGYNDHNATNVNPLEVAADYYLYDAIASGVMSTHLHNGPKKMSYNWQLLHKMFEAGLAAKRSKEKTPLELVIEQGLQGFTAHVVNNVDVFHSYSHYAIMSEMRYSKGIKKIIPEAKSGRFAGQWKTIGVEAGNDKLMKWAGEFFRNGDYGYWSSAYGGEPWALATDVVGMYEVGKCEGMAFSEREFLDRVFSLEHNTGTFLNKWCWGGSVEYMKKVLEAHKESDWLTLTKYASLETKVLWGRYLYLSGIKSVGEYGKRVNQGFNEQEQESKNPTPIVEAPKVGVLKIPTPQELLHKAGIEKIMPSVYVGKCKTSGKVIDKGVDIVWHGKGKGASLLTEWNKL